jgi:hypothetical protein
MFISVGCDGNNMFQGVRANVITLMKKNVVPFLMGVHYFSIEPPLQFYEN